MPKIYDISIHIAPGRMPVWPGDPEPVLERFLKMEDGNDANVSRLAACVHLGTHVDAPHHFIAEGATTEALPLDVLVGKAYVVDLTELKGHITAAALEAADLPPDAGRLLFKTRNSRWWAQGDASFHTDFVALTADAAEYLVNRGVRLVGIDYLSIAPYDAPVPTHRILLGAGVVVVETLDLSAVPAGTYILYCLPLKLVGSEGAPARAILVP
jgi:arylformamidase